MAPTAFPQFRATIAWVSEGGLELEQFHAQKSRSRLAEREIGSRWAPLLTVAPCNVALWGCTDVEVVLTIATPRSTQEATSVA